MRKFNYITDYSLINSSVRGYIIELEKELAMLIDMEEDNNIYIETYKKLKEFKNKYSDMHDVYNKILNDLLSNESVEYCVKNGIYQAVTGQLKAVVTDKWILCPVCGAKTRTQILKEI